MFTLEVYVIIFFLSVELCGAFSQVKNENCVATLLQSHTVISKLKTKLHAVNTYWKRSSQRGLKINI